MDELGQILRQAREKKGLSVEEVYEATRINPAFITALEEGEYRVLPTATHARGFLRNYARFLGLDPEPLQQRLVLNQSRQAPAQDTVNPRQAEPEAGVPLPAMEEQPFFDPVNVEVDLGSRRDPESAVRLIIIAALIIAVALVSNRFLPMIFNNNDGSEAITAGITDAVQSLVGEESAADDGTDVDTAALDEAASGEEAEVINSTSRTGTGPGTEILPTPSPTRPTLPATLDEINLKLEVTERTWLESTIDEEVVYSGIARAGDTFEWTAEDEAKLLTGNAIGVFVTINDIPLGRLGDRGQNKEEIWRTTEQ